MYDGTLAGHWQAIVTMQQLIVLADADGVIDMTPDAISRRTSIPIEIIEAGIKALEAPDPYSRTPGHEGRRIERLDDHRPWGWHLVNHEKYKYLKDADEVRTQNRERQQRFRDRNRVTPSNAPSRDVTLGNEKSRHTDTDTDTEKHIPPYSGGFLKFWGAWPKSERKESKGKCWEVWRARGFDRVAETILAHVESLKSSGRWREGFIPAPLVYLNQRRWEGAETVSTELKGI